MDNKGVGDNYIELDVNILELAYVYLQKKARITHKEYSMCDLFMAAEQILRWNEARRKNDDPKMLFKCDKVFVHKKYIKRFGGTEGSII